MANGMPQRKVGVLGSWVWFKIPRGHVDVDTVRIMKAQFKLIDLTTIIMRWEMIFSGRSFAQFYSL